MSGDGTTWVVRLMIPSVTAAMNAIPDESPSRPSIQLMLLIIPTIQKMVRPAATRPSKRMRSGPNGLATNVIETPRKTARQATAIWPSELEAGPQVEQVVDGTEAGGQRAAEQEGDRLGRVETERDRDEMRVLVEDQEEPGDQRGTRRRRRARRRAGRRSC